MPQVIHAHLWPAALFAAPIASEARIGCVVHVHDSQPWLSSRRFLDSVLRMLQRRALNSKSLRMLAVSESAKRYAAANLPWPAEAICVVHNGVDVDHFCPSQHRAETETIPTIGALGRLEPEKGFVHLIHAAAEMRESGARFRLLIAGEGSQRAELDACITKNSLNDIVSLVGVVRDVRAFYEKLDIFVFPSIAPEGLPMAILEAMSMGLPVVATTVAGPPEVIGTDGVYGLLVSPANPTTLISAIQPLITDKELRSQFGSRARRRVEREFACKDMARQVRRTYEELI
jgi:glycosyltransferase involved in cell wall biosynthesis